MAATTAGAVKALVESLGLSVTAYRDGAPTDADGNVDAPFPHVVIQEGMAYDQDQAGDFGDPAAIQQVTELVQVDLFQLARKLVGGVPGSVNAEDYLLPGKLRAGLHGARLAPIGLQRVAGVIVQGGRRWPIADNIVRHTIDVLVRRELNRSA
jgi:hypothetical protein